MEDVIVMNEKYKNCDLAHATKEIYKIGATMRKCAFETAYIIAGVHNTECYKEDGFKSVHEWTEKTFGFKKSVSYSLLKIGNEYIEAIQNTKTGKITGYISVLKNADDNEDYTTTQIEKMLPLGREKAMELTRNHTINPDMTCREIAKVVKDALGKGGDSEDEEGTDNKQEQDMIWVYDGYSNWYLVPGNVLSKYKADKDNAATLIKAQ